MGVGHRHHPVTVSLMSPAVPQTPLVGSIVLTQAGSVKGGGGVALAHGPPARQALHAGEGQAWIQQVLFLAEPLGHSKLWITLLPDSKPWVKPQVLLPDHWQTPEAVQVGSVVPLGVHQAQLSANSGIEK